MKRIVCIVILTCASLGAAFAQQKPATPAAPAAPAKESKELKNSIGLDAFQLFKGFVASNDDFLAFNLSSAYERLIVPHFSLGADLDLFFMNYDMGNDDVPCVYFSLAAEGRYYPSANFEKFFIGTTLGFNMLSMDGKTKAEDGGFAGLIISLKTGYKLITKSGFYLEPSLAYVLSKSSTGFQLLSEAASLLGINIDVPAPPTPLGWNGGLRIGYAF